MKMSKNKQTRRLRELLDILLFLDEVKPEYKRMDEIIKELSDADFEGSAEIDGYILTLFDRFSDSNIAWKSTAITRFFVQHHKRKNDGRKKAA